MYERNYPQGMGDQGGLLNLGMGGISRSDQELAKKVAADQLMQQSRKGPVSEALDDLQTQVGIAQEQMARIADRLNPVLAWEEPKPKGVEMPPQTAAFCDLEERIRTIYFEFARFNDGLRELSDRIRL